ncbi:MAG TPA: hypothetical protein VMX74_01135 [Pirellulales bacterium]|nr:hypothetical protein [Pirellulales bacterium]
MKLDCVKASDVGLGKGWAVINMENGGVVHHDADTDSEFAWMGAAEVLAEAISDMQRTIYNLSPQQFSESK